MLTGEKLKVVWAEFSTLSLAVLIMRATAWHRQTHPHAKLKTRPRFCPVSLSLSMTSRNFLRIRREPSSVEHLSNKVTFTRLPENLVLNLENLARVNILAYFAALSVTKKKSLMGQHQVSDF